VASATGRSVVLTARFTVSNPPPWSLFAAAPAPDPATFRPGHPNAGVSFTTETAGSVSAVRYFEVATATGSDEVELDGPGGTLAWGAVAHGAGAGWAELHFVSPVGIAPGVVYTVALHAKGGTTAAPVPPGGQSTRGPLHPADGTSGLGGAPAGWIDVVAGPDAPLAGPSVLLPSGSGGGVSGPPPWPDPSSVGVPPGTPLRVTHDDLIITVPDTVVTNMDFEGGCISVRADDVVIRDTIVRSTPHCGDLNMVIDAGYDHAGPTQQRGLVIEDSVIDGMGAPGDTIGVGQSYFTCVRCEIRGVAKGVKADRSVLVQDSLISGLASDGATHTEPVLYDGGQGGIVLRHNTLISNRDHGTAAVAILGDYCPVTNVVVDDNQLENGSYEFYGGMGEQGKRCPNGDQVVVTNNLFGPVTAAGYATNFDLSGAGNAWGGNLDEHRQPLALSTALRSASP